MKKYFYLLLLALLPISLISCDDDENEPKYKLANTTWMSDGNEELDRTLVNSKYFNPDGGKIQHVLEFAADECHIFQQNMRTKNIIKGTERWSPYTIEYNHEYGHKQFCDILHLNGDDFYFYSPTVLVNNINPEYNTLTLHKK